MPPPPRWLEWGGGVSGHFASQGEPDLLGLDVRELGWRKGRGAGRLNSQGEPDPGLF